MDPITTSLRAHYEDCFAMHGAGPQGVDWGPKAADAQLRYDKMLAVRDGAQCPVEPSLLDVGCGYGGLLERAKERNIALDYCGLDVCEPMVAHAQLIHPEARFRHGDFFTQPPDEPFDLVVCNGILTQKLDASIAAMEAYARELIQGMYERCRVGIAFNVMTTKVNFMADNLFYKSPVELLSFALTLTPKVRLDHAYRLYEYTTYLYRPEAMPEPPCTSA